MPSGEQISVFSYNSIVETDISYYRNEGWSPNAIGSGTFTLMEQYKRVPIWAKSFAEKPIQPEAANIFSNRIEDEERLILMEVPRQYRAIILEREILSDIRKRNALVERIYGVRIGNQTYDLLFMTSLTRPDWPDNMIIDSNEWIVTAQSHDMYEAQGSVKSKNLQRLLKQREPIVSSALGMRPTVQTKQRLQTYTRISSLPWLEVVLYGA